MRALLIVGTLVTATLIPWDSLTIPWASIPTGHSETQAGSAARMHPLGARLAPTLGIMPLTEEIPETQTGDERTQTQRAQSPGDGDAVSVPRTSQAVGENRPKTRSGDHHSAPPGVVCKDGVCTLPQRSSVEATAPTSTTRPDAALLDLTWEQARERLQQLGATQFRLEMNSESGQYRFCCCVPVRGQTNAGRQFEACGSSDMEAVRQTLEQAEAWRRERR